MAFEFKVYRDDVLKPNARGEGHEQLREALSELQQNPSSRAYVRLDLHTLFAIPSPVGATELAEWNRKIVPALNKSSASLSSAKLLKDLLEILKDRGDILEPEFWGRLQAQRAEVVLEQLQEGIGQLRPEYPLGVVTLEDITSRLATIGVSGVTPSSITSAAESAGLKVFPAVALPENGVPQALKTIWKQMSRHTEYRTVLDVLLLHRLDELSNVAVIEHLRSGSNSIGLTDIDAARAKGEQSSDTDALQDAQKFLGALREHCKMQSDLNGVVLATLLEFVEARLTRGRPRLTIRDELVSAGIAPADAARLVSAVSASGVAGRKAKGAGLEEVRALLAQAQLAEAERMLSSIDAGEGEEAREHRSVTELLQALRVKKEGAVGRYASALAVRDFVAAEIALRDAIQIDLGDDHLTQLRDALPPPAPRSLQARVDSDAVVLTWATVADESILHSVVRGDEHPPISHTDGTMVTASKAGNSVRDERGSAGQQSTYAVFATRDGKVFSDPAMIAVTLLPVPHAFRAVTHSSGARLTWTRPDLAAGVIVTQTDPSGASQVTQVLRGSELSVEKLTTGTSYHFTIQAIYLLAEGRRLSDSTSITVVPRGVASAVLDLDLSIGTLDGQNALDATWTAPADAEIEFWQFESGADLQPGAHIAPSAVTKLGGRRMSALPGHQRGSATFESPTGIVKVAPLTVTDGGYLVGTPVVTGAAPSPTNIVSEQFGDELRLSWVWPSGDHLMELRWVQESRSRRRRVTHARYRAEGGAKLAGASGISQLTIATVDSLDDREWTSAPIPVEVNLSAESGRASYSLQIKRALFGGKRTIHISARTSDRGIRIPVDVILKQGTIMPMDASEGRTLAQIDLDFTRSSEYAHRLEVEKLQSPFWICLFSRDASLQLEPPATSEMKG
ncbi:hypothetical protein C5B85_11775 [Pseudoclavibacter sp. AY1F1]|uniref:fibronectin type III domain-containing protein n=1 Tax=Pseudoclavibacter sp. AY1F1 TaxID=2080583 RepID=UPI000CE89DDD|nr:fibronectin type III domain-containing protein [Pseudoclavibacter sp. AY1F1]PPF43822.1 hypothetical protein C5B85_11775 [Pseudoclavibacter sp. AY1F1]